jgi:paraquat-inducible protein B
MTRDRKGQIPIILSHTEKTLKAAQAALENTDPNSPMMVDLATLAKEMSGAARSLRILADYLEEHPEALIQGKK